MLVPRKLHASLVCTTFVVLVWLVTIYEATTDVQVCSSPFRFLNHRYFTTLVLSRFSSPGVFQSIIEAVLVYIFASALLSERAQVPYAAVSLFILVILK